MKHIGNWRYKAVPEECCHPDIGVYHTYGIQSSSQIFVHDVSTDRDTVEELARLFSEHQLDPIHLKDAIEDMLP